ncbi:MAG: helix-turn-helix domain-containing protein [Hyphomicrobiaceae bacterium]
MQHEEITPEQCRAGRALIDWTQERLAEAAGVGLSTCKDLESGKRTPRRISMRALRKALEDAGVEFLGDGAQSEGGGPGVRLQPQTRK